MRAGYGLIVLGLLAVGTTRADPQIDGGEGYTCAVGDGGRAFCWGLNTSSQTGSGLGMPVQSSVSRPTEIAGGFVTVASGAWHSCGLQADGSAYCWGLNHRGQLGNGKIGKPEVVSLPVRVQTKARFKSITVGGAHTCATDEDDAAWCWGSNANSQLGQYYGGGTSGTLFASTPTLVLPPTLFGPVLSFQSLSAGAAHTCGLDTSGAAWCWGSNINGRAGIDITQCGGPVALNCDFYRPVLTMASGGGVVFSGLYNLRFTSISAGELNTCAIDTSGIVQCWGPNFLRGRSFTGGMDRPSDVPAVAKSGPAVSVSAGGSSVCAVTTSGEMYCWGRHDHGQLGDGSPISATAMSLTPVRVAGSQDYAAVTVGSAHACGQTLTGLARCWGINDEGELGSDALVGTQINMPMTVVGLETRLLTSGARHMCSLDAARVVACWGRNIEGQIGHGRASEPAPTSSVVPTPVARFYGVRRTLFPPSINQPPEQLSNTMPPIKTTMGTVEFTRLSVGGQHVCALNAAGVAYCWGVDRVGQVGNGKRYPVACRYGAVTAETPLDCVPYPTIVSRDDRHFFADISAGAAHNCARTANGIVSCWGSARYGELGSTTTATFLRVPTQIEVPFPYRPYMLDVSAGEASSCAVNGNDMFCWGDIAGKPTPVPMSVPSGPSYLQVATGARHACTSFQNMSLMCIGDNQFGQLGNGTNTPSWTGTQVWSGTLLTSYMLSWGTSCGVDAWSGTVACWGNNGQGELGNGMTLNANVPQFTLTPSSFSATEIGIGFSHACAIDGKGAAMCWGDNRYAQLGIGESTSPPVTVPVSVAAGWQLP